MNKDNNELPFFMLPKSNKDGMPILSYSQVATWLRNKKDYIREYFFGDKEKLEVYIDFGSKVGYALENNDFSNFEESEKEVLQKIKRLDIFEKYVEIPFDKFRFIGYIDTASEDLSYIIDYKTGSENKQVEYSKEDYLQIKLYAGAVKQITGKLPSKAEVILIERLGNPFKGEKLVVGNNYWIIEQDISEESVEQAFQIVKDAAEEISKYYNVFKKLNV